MFLLDMYPGLSPTTYLINTMVCDTVMHDKIEKNIIRSTIDHIGI